MNACLGAKLERYPTPLAKVRVLDALNADQPRRGRGRSGELGDRSLRANDRHRQEARPQHHRRFAKQPRSRRQPLCRPERRVEQVGKFSDIGGTALLPVSAHGKADDVDASLIQVVSIHMAFGVKQDNANTCLQKDEYFRLNFRR